jgi:hypothetical protein
MRLKHLIIGTGFLFVTVQQCEAARFALLVGNSRGGADVSELRYVENDLLSLRTILKEYCGFDNQHMVLLQDKSPQDLEAALTDLKGKLPLTEDNLLLFYYSGHADQSSLKMGGEKFPLQSLKDRFSAFPVPIRIGVFDACQSGSFTRLKGGALSEPFLFKEDSKIKGQVILSSSSATENAQESDLLKNSVFTFHLVNALRGSADMSGDRKVTLAEAYQYSYNHTVSSTASTWGGTQHPSYQFQIQGEGDIVLADLNIRSQGILLQGGLSGTITIQDEKGNVVADLDKDRQSTVMIALDPGAYNVFRNEDGRMWRSEVMVASVTVQLGENDFTLTKSQQSRKKGTLPRYTSLNFGVSGGVRRMVMKDLDEQMMDRFSGYRMFGMYPVCNFPYESFSGGIVGEFVIRGNYLVTLSYEKSKWEENQSLKGGRSIGDNKSSTGVSLILKRSLELSTFDIGTGYRMSRGMLRGLSGTAGLSFVGGDFTVATDFKDSLFDVTEKKEFKDEGVKIIPYAALAYLYQFTPFLALGAQARFRYQKRPESFYYGMTLPQFTTPGNPESIDDEEFRYQFRGVEFHINLLFTLRIREVEE